MDFPTICKKFYYCLYKITLYVKVILLKACFKYEKAYIKNRFFKDFPGRVHLNSATTKRRGNRHSREFRPNGQRRSQEPLIATRCYKRQRPNTGGGR